MDQQYYLVCGGSAGVEASANVAVVVQPQYLALFPVWKKLSTSDKKNEICRHEEFALNLTPFR